MNESQIEASRLGDLWNRLAAQHITLGCSCSMTGLSVTLEDFERDIADYLWAESERLGYPGVVEFLLAPGPIESQDRAIRGILSRIEAGEAGGASDEVCAWLLPRMKKTIESYDKLHSPAPDALFRGGASAWRGGYRE